MKSKIIFFEIIELGRIKEVNQFELFKHRIKQVVAKKDEAFNQLKQQYESACKRADHLEGLLEQQRTLMLKKQSKD
jgi:hypothetical protein